MADPSYPVFPQARSITSELDPRSDTGDYKTPVQRSFYESFILRHRWSASRLYAQVGLKLVPFFGFILADSIDPPLLYCLILTHSQIILVTLFLEGGEN